MKDFMTDAIYEYLFYVNPNLFYLGKRIIKWARERNQVIAFSSNISYALIPSKPHLLK
jgi:hypothetical protein